jgi:hypothetical protein
MSRSSVCELSKKEQVGLTVGLGPSMKRGCWRVTPGEIFENRYTIWCILMHFGAIPYENMKRSRARAELGESSASSSRAREIVRNRLVLLSDELTSSALIGQDRRARDELVSSSAMIGQDRL